MRLGDIDVYAFVCGALSLALGTVVIFGWYTQNITLIQIHPAFAPMQYNTALGFVLAGAGLAFFSMGKVHAAQFLGFAAMCLGALSLSQYIFHIDFGIDQLFTDFTVMTRASHAGRMSPATSMCFSMIGLALILAVHMRLASIALSVAVLVMSLLTFAGYLFGDDNIYGWGSLTRMAVHTASCFLILSFGLMFYCIMKRRGQQVDPWTITPVVVPMVVIAISLFSWQSLIETTRQRNSDYFDTLVSDIQRSLEERYTLYEQSLWGGLGLFYASDSVEREEWKSYVKTMDIKNLLPGIGGIGYIEYVLAQDMEDFLARTRADGVPHFKAYPETFYPDKFVIKYIEPIESNYKALGLDIGFEANRRAAAERARDLGVPALTKIIELVQDDKKQAGFLLLIPAYDTREIPPTLEEKRAHFTGWVYAPFIGPHFFRDLVDVGKGQIHFKVYDGRHVEPETLIYDSKIGYDENEAAAFEKITHVKFAGRIWTIKWHSSSLFKPPASRALSVIVALCGFIFSIFLYFILRFLIRSKQIIIDEVKKRTQELVESERRMHAIVHDSINGVLIINDKGIIQNFNPAAEQMFGYKAEEVVGENIKMLIPQPHKRNHDAYIEKFLETGQSNIIGNVRDVEAEHRDGKIFPVQLSVSQIELEDGTLLFSGIVQDVTELQEAERQRNLYTAQLEQAKEEAQRANVMKSEFLANMSHEIRTPLNGIIGASDLMRKIDITPDQQKYLNIITNSGDTLLALINDILDLSKIEAGELNINLEPVVLREFMRDAVRAITPRADDKNIEMGVEYSGDVPVSIMADGVRLHQIMMNLLGNAVKFVEKGHIAVGVVGQAVSNGNVKLRITVEDTGIGIPADKLDTIFDKFAQADATTTKKYGGTGLGLAITHKLVELMGGMIGVASEVGVGTTFWFEITCPVVDADEAQDSADVTESSEEQQASEEGQDDKPADLGTLDANILLVENELVNQMVATDMLESIGCHVDLAENGQEALDMLADKEGAYDVVLMDCMMPIMDGFEATQKIREREDSENVPGEARQIIIAMTANAMAGEKDKCLEIGMDDYLSKPVKEDVLYAKLKEYIEKGDTA